MTKAQLIVTLLLAAAALPAGPASAADANHRHEKAAETTAAPAPGKSAEDATLFNRVNGTYRKSEKQLLPQT